MNPATCEFSPVVPQWRRSARPAIHHHLEMEHPSVTVVIAHIRYLKIRLFDFAAKRPPVMRWDLLEQLAALYRT